MAELSYGSTVENVTSTRKKKRGKREIKADETRRALFSAAATVVGKRGYEGASIAEITRLAGVANGTFYNYFDNRQALFDQLLPAVGESLLDYIRSRISDDMHGIEREECRIVAYFEFFQKNPGWLRILNEAEVYAPKAYKRHVNNFADRYIRALKRQMEDGELQGYDEHDLEVVVYILMGARSYLTTLLHTTATQRRASSVRALIETYMKLLKTGLFANPAETGQKRRPRR